MRFIFIVLFLVSFGSVIFGDDGDVYFCSIEKRAGINSSPDKYVKFKFKIEPNKLIIKGMGSGDNEKWYIIDYKKGKAYGRSSGDLMFVAQAELKYTHTTNTQMLISFFDPKLVYVYLTANFMSSFEATCDKF